ncbi:MAG: nucleotidyl transferase AbiEii/AbiGii toxin family protein [Yoonia sp.]|uniref:nucleotidyl transferase AbiEii/AbiGii toxin family protein n=1 Tax=Yoonia sp. TaxID=2212373 RepID=UPI003EFADEF6
MTPRLLSYVEASVAEMQFALGEATYNGDGSGHLKVAFDGIGEIDFIVTAHMTDQPTRDVELEGRTVALETIPEIIAKKVRFRGARIQPLGIFDIAAGVEASFGPGIQAALADIPDYVGSPLLQFDKLSVDYVNHVNAQLMLRSTSQHLV